MWAFRPERGGYTSTADETERHVVRGLARDVCFMLGERISDILEQRAERAQAAFDDGFDPWDPLAGYEAELSDLAELGIAMDQISEPADGALFMPDESGDDRHVPMDEAILHLLPDMSEDPELARELRNITQDSVSRQKVENLATLYASLDGDSDTVWITNEDAPAWLAAINDIRIVLAARLNIVDDASSEQAYDRAAEMTGNGSERDLHPVETSDDLLTVLYSMLTWWQESLLLAVGNKARRK